MAELLQRASAMPVSQVVDGQRVQPDPVYVIPPGRDLALLHGVLHLMEPAEQRGLRLPVQARREARLADQKKAFERAGAGLKSAIGGGR